MSLQGKVALVTGVGPASAGRPLGPSPRRGPRSWSATATANTATFIGTLIFSAFLHADSITPGGGERH